MKFGKAIILGTILATFVSAAVADTLKTTGSTATSGITATGIQLNGVITSGAHKNQAPGTVTGTSDGIFAAFTSGTAMYYTPPLISGNPAFHFDGALSDGPSVAHPVHLYEIVAGGETLDLYLTNVDTVVKAAAGVKGGFSATGYITLTGYSVNIPVTFTLYDNSTGTGKQAFTTTLTATAPITSTPEPSSLALLGTGILSAAGMGYRKLRATV